MFYKPWIVTGAASFNYVFSQNANIYQLFSKASASFNSPNFFQKIKCIGLTETQMANIEHRYKKVALTLPTFDSDYSRISKKLFLKKRKPAAQDLIRNPMRI